MFVFAGISTCREGYSSRHDESDGTELSTVSNCGSCRYKVSALLAPLL